MPFFWVVVCSPQIHGGSEKTGYDVLTCWPSLHIHGEDRDEASKSTPFAPFKLKLHMTIDVYFGCIDCNNFQRFILPLLELVTKSHLQFGRLTFHRWNASLPRFGTLILGDVQACSDTPRNKNQNGI